MCVCFLVIVLLVARAVMMTLVLDYAPGVLLIWLASVCVWVCDGECLCVILLFFL